MPILNCYLYNVSVDKVEDVRCSNKEKCQGCIFVVSTQEDENQEVLGGVI